VSALRRHGLPQPAGDGLNLWLPVRDEPAALISLASNGIAAAAGTAFTVTPTDPHLRVTVGLITTDHEAIATHLAEAAHSPAQAAPR
jgi:hypothetical protein